MRAGEHAEIKTAPAHSDAVVAERLRKRRTRDEREERGWIAGLKSVIERALCQTLDSYVKPAPGYQDGIRAGSLLVAELL